MECFIKKIFNGKESKEAHQQFVRFGKGLYEGRAAISFNAGTTVKIGGSFEYANDFVNLILELGNFDFSGVILSKEKLELTGKPKGEILKYDFQGNSEDVKKIVDKAYFMLLNVDSSDIKLKIKGKLPKPGKSGESKIDDKFCIIEANIKYLNKIKEAFVWDVPNCKKAKIMHTYEVKDIILPKGEKDFKIIRLLAKRKGKIIRKIDCDGRTSQIEKDFEV
jgi:hypothetical protein